MTIASQSTVSNSKIPFFLEKFNRNRFLQILWMLRLKKLAQSDGTIRTRIQKASNYVEYIDSKFRQSVAAHESEDISNHVVVLPRSIKTVRLQVT